MITIKDFYADWCCSCREVSAKLDKASIKVEKINVDDTPVEVLDIYEVNELPLLVAEKDGEVISVWNRKEDPVEWATKIMKGETNEY